MNASREGFEAWAASEGIDCSTVEDGWHFQQMMTETLWEGWSARDSEVERLREALKDASLLIEAEFFDAAQEKIDEALSSPQVKESGK